MTDSSGNLSVDFLVGFTIFMVAFIWVATLVPNLFLGISSHGIDFDAVAYRTGVILAEDPGATNASMTGPWELQPDSAKENIERFGLAISKETPNILSEAKVNRFFCSTVFSYPDDYRKKAIFGDYPYRFNISLQGVGDTSTRFIGDTLPGSNYGYIRREVKIKHFSNATLNQTIYINDGRFGFNNTENATSHEFSIKINTTELLFGNISNPVTNPNRDAAYQIDPRSDRISISITELDGYPPRQSVPVAQPVVAGELNITKITFSQNRYGFPGLFPMVGSRYTNFAYEDGNLTPVNPPFTVNSYVNLSFEPGFFSAADETGAIYVNVTFEMLDPAYPDGKQFLNNTYTRPFEYNYNASRMTPPTLTDAVMEVAIW
jgi:hypothetical protein